MPEITNAALAEKIDALAQIIAEMKNSQRDLVVTLRGEKDSPGLVGQVDDLKRKMGTISRLAWLSIGSGLGAMVTLIVTHIRIVVP